MSFLKNTKLPYTIFWLIILCVFFRGILCINLSKNPYFYCTDMYSDMIYSTEVWKEGSLFPDGWVFGNQLYIVATPVVAALFFAIVRDPCIAMGIASTLMGFGVIFSFCWMLKPLFAQLHQRLFAAVSFMILVLLCGDAVFSVTGWQLFFTMCSYYACYAITIFLAFGCYLRSNSHWTWRLHATFILTCALSFGTGMQSLRQTAIMVLPLLAVEFLKIICNIISKEKHTGKSIGVVLALSVSNLTGVLYIKCLSVEKKEIFGRLSFRFPSDFLTEINSYLSAPFKLFPAYSKFAMFLFFVVCIYSAVMVLRKKKWMHDPAFVCVLLHIVSILAVLLIRIFTTMYVREIYYFMLYPLTAILIAFVYSRFRSTNSLLAVILIIWTLPTCREKLAYYTFPTEEHFPIQQVSDYLKENEITTIYSHWNVGEKIAIASDFDIEVGFWDDSLDVFNSVKYLCNPNIFDADIKNCAYVVSGQDTFDKANEIVNNRGIELHLMQYFPESNLYVFNADQKLMN